MPGMGGMPGMGAFADVLPVLLARIGLQGVEPTHLGIAGAGLMYLLLYASWALRAIVAALCALAFFSHRSAFQRAGGGIKGCAEVGRAAVSQLSARATSMSGRPIHTTHILGVLACLLAIAAYLLPAGGGRAKDSASGGTYGEEQEFALRAAYHAGFDDAAAGKTRDPDNYLAYHAPSPGFSAAPSSSFGGEKKSEL